MNELRVLRALKRNGGEMPYSRLLSLRKGKLLQIQGILFRLKSSGCVKGELDGDLTVSLTPTGYARYDDLLHMVLMELVAVATLQSQCRPSHAVFFVFASPPTSQILRIQAPSLHHRLSSNSNFSNR